MRSALQVPCYESIQIRSGCFLCGFSLRKPDQQKLALCFALRQHRPSGFALLLTHEPKVFSIRLLTNVISCRGVVTNPNLGFISTYCTATTDFSCCFPNYLCVMPAHFALGTSICAVCVILLFPGPSINDVRGCNSLGFRCS